MTLPPLRRFARAVILLVLTVGLVLAGPASPADAASYPKYGQRAARSGRCRTS